MSNITIRVPIGTVEAPKEAEDLVKHFGKKKFLFWTPGKRGRPPLDSVLFTSSDVPGALDYDEVVRSMAPAAGG